MLKKYLPRFLKGKQKEKNPPSKASSELTQSEKDPYSAIFGSNAAPNFALKLELENPNYYYYAIFARLFKFGAFFVVVSFMGLLILNLYFDLKLESLNRMLQSRENVASAYRSTRDIALDVDKKIKFYNNTLSQRAIVGDKAASVFGALGSGVEFVSLVIDSKNFFLTVTAENASEFAQLLATYSEDPLIRELSLTSATVYFNPKRYEISLEGKF